MPVFTSTPASLRARRASRTSASTPAPTPAQTESTGAATTQPSSDVTAPASASPLESDSILLKAKRAYERDRQRAKKRKERADRERERTTSSENHLPSPDARHAREGSGRKAAVRPRLALDASPADVVTVSKEAPLSPQVEEIIADVVERAAHARGEPLEVHLGALVKPARARKSKAGEFELVPSVPVVIALDDRMPDAAELDEPWEHISADELDERRVKPLSYATVLAHAL